MTTDNKPASNPSVLSCGDSIGLVSASGIWISLVAAVVLLCGFWSPPGLSFGETPAAELPVESKLVPVAAAAENEETTTRVTTFDDVKFDMKKGDPFLRTMLPAKIEQMKGTKIRIRGYMLPSFKQKGITEFVLVRDNMECCFGPGAALYDCILIHMSPGSSASFSTRPITVEGVFTIEEFKDPDGKHLAIYRLDANSAQ